MNFRKKKNFEKGGGDHFRSEKFHCKFSAGATSLRKKSQYIFQKRGGWGGGDQSLFGNFLKIRPFLKIQASLMIVVYLFDKQNTWLEQESFRPECCSRAAVDKPSNTLSLGCNTWIYQNCLFPASFQHLQTKQQTKYQKSVFKKILKKVPLILVYLDTSTWFCIRTVFSKHR